MCYVSGSNHSGLKERAHAHARAYKANKIVIEDADAGTYLIQELKKSGLPVVAVRPERDKKTRLLMQLAKFEAGLVFFPRQAPWLPEYQAEIFAFPKVPFRRPSRQHLSGSSRRSVWLRYRCAGERYGATSGGSGVQEYVSMVTCRGPMSPCGGRKTWCFETCRPSLKSVRARRPGLHQDRDGGIGDRCKPYSGAAKLAYGCPRMTRAQKGNQEAGATTKVSGARMYTTIARF